MTGRRPTPLRQLWRRPRQELADRAVPQPRVKERTLVRGERTAVWAGLIEHGTEAAKAPTMNRWEKPCLQEAAQGGVGGRRRLHIASTSAASLSGGQREVSQQEPSHSHPAPKAGPGGEALAVLPSSSPAAHTPLAQKVTSFEDEKSKTNHHRSCTTNILQCIKERSRGGIGR